MSSALLGFFQSEAQPKALVDHLFEGLLSRGQFLPEVLGDIWV